MNEIYAALIGVGGALLLGWLTQRWNAHARTEAWQEKAGELAEQLEAAHKETADELRGQVADLQGQLRRRDRVIESLTSAQRKGDGGDDEG